MFRNLGHDPTKPVRSTTYTGYIQPVLASRPNLQVETMATASRLLFSADGKRVEGVEYVQRGQSHRVAATREVIVSSGAINSPKLLLQSGVGPAEELEPLGVKPVLDLPGVGRNLQDHFAQVFVYLLNPEGAPELEKPSPTLIAFLKSPGSPFVDQEVAWGLLPPGNILVVVAYSVRNEHRGALRLDSADPLAPAQLSFGLDPYGGDVVKLAQLGRTIRTWLLKSGLAAMEMAPGLTAVPDDEDDAPWHAWFSSRMQSIYHAAGTCRMGPRSEAQSVVDARLRVHGISNLRVADCSIMPRLVSTHPSATAVMIGEKCASMIREDARPR
jgi:choline dehydrogenase